MNKIPRVIIFFIIAIVAPIIIVQYVSFSTITERQAEMERACIIRNRMLAEPIKTITPEPTITATPSPTLKPVKFVPVVSPVPATEGAK